MAKNFLNADTRSKLAIFEWLFSQYGPPETLDFDNGSQFTSETFLQFCSLCYITRFWSTPFHPQSNGQAERLVDTFKRSLLKAKE